MRGFTLVEVSIVIVIIGLIIGGIFVGKDLLLQSSIRAQISQIDAIEASINTFRLKYGCLPGDCPNATDIFGTTDPLGNTVVNGNGDNIIKSTYGLGTAYGAGECLLPDITGEVSQLFMHIGLAQLGDYAKGTLNISHARIGNTFPYAKLGNGTGVFVSCMGSLLYPNLPAAFLRQGNILVMGASGNTANGWGGAGGRIFYASGFGAIWGQFGQDGSSIPIPPMGFAVDVARIIDEKTDDGKPSSGKIGIIAGQGSACDNAAKANTSQPLLTAYPGSTVCNVVIGKKIN